MRALSAKPTQGDGDMGHNWTSFLKHLPTNQSCAS